MQFGSDSAQVKAAMDILAAVIPEVCVCILSRRILWRILKGIFSHFLVVYLQMMCVCVGGGGGGILVYYSKWNRGFSAVSV